MSLDVYQQVFSLSMAANSVNNLKGKQTALQESLQSILEDVSLPMISGWDLVWGPVVWKVAPDEETTGPENSWYVAYHPTLRFEDGTVAPTYVIAIAGTPSMSKYAWVEENLGVHTVVDFKKWIEGGLVEKPDEVKNTKDIVQGNAYIALGTVNAVHLLLNTVAPEGARSAGQNLLSFLGTAAAQSNDCRFIATGYSLGGALSPSLALALVQAGTIPADRTLTYPCAGPSPGNQGFTDLFVETLPGVGSGEEGSYKGWNRNIVNRLDVVPQAWCPRNDMCPDQNLGNIPSIYGEPIVQEVFAAYIGSLALAFKAGIVYKPLPSQFFRGETPAWPEDLEQFVATVMKQHIDAYIDFFGITIPKADEQKHRAGLKEKNKEEQRFNYPVIADYEWALEHPEDTHLDAGKVEGAGEGA